MSTRSAVARTPATPTTLQLLFIVGSLMTMAALATDVMLPAFPTMAAELGVSDAAIQRVLSVFMLGYGLPQLLVGSAADRFGRRPVLMAGMLVYATGSLVCLLAPGFTGLLIGRFIQGLGCAAGPVLARTVLRDLYSGSQLGRMMSFAMIFFTAAPLLAPSIGAVIMQFGDWHWQFVFLLAVAGLMLLMIVRMLPETAPRLDPAALSPRGLVRNALHIFRDPQSAWAIVLITLGYGTLMAYLASGPGIFMNHYGLSETQFGLAFAAIASVSFVTQPLNARMLLKYRPVQILSVTLPLWLAVCLLLLLQTALGIDTVLSFALNMAAFFAGFSLVLANTMTLILEPHYERAGMASGVSGFIQLSAGTLAGSAVAAFTVAGPLPLAAGLALLATLCLPAFLLTARAARARA